MLITEDALACASIVRQGGVIAYPTEAVWGLGCLPQDQSAVEKILKIKSRAESKGFIVICQSQSVIAPLLSCLTQEQRALADLYWPGPTTLLIPDRVGFFPECVRGEHHNIAVRVTAHEPIYPLLNAVGGTLISTSANPAGRAPAKSIDELTAYFNQTLDGIYQENLGFEKKPSAIIDVTTGEQLR